jgi:hypothetical protein
MGKRVQVSSSKIVRNVLIALAVLLALIVLWSVNLGRAKEGIELLQPHRQAQEEALERFREFQSPVQAAQETRVP